MGNRAFGLVALVTMGAGLPLLLACSPSSPGSTVVTGAGLATSCSTNDDCVSVYFGDVCEFCTQDNAAIASSAEAVYQNASNAAGSRCPPRSIAGSCASDRTITTCAMGTCTLATCPGVPASAHACASTNDAGVVGGDAG